MIITGCTTEDLRGALAKVNENYESNIIFNRFDALNGKDTRHAVTLRCVSGRGAGHRMTVLRRGKQRKLVASCWHVHGSFFNALPAGTKIRSMGGTTVCDGVNTDWHDWNIGSMMYPTMASEACECGGI